MFRSLYKLVAVGFLIFLKAPVMGFSLIGPSMPYQVGLSPRFYSSIIAPQSRDEEYRWNVPVITYGFDQQFFNYFGTNGINSIQEIFRILNDLPPISQISDQVLSNYLFSAEEINVQAETLRLVDLKSYVMSLVMGHVGLIEPETYVWSVRNRWIDTAGITNYVVFIRNYDPITRFPSPVINGTTYSYSLQGDFVNVLPFTSSTAASSILGNGRSPFGIGFHGRSFWGLTYDDVGGLRHIYATNNFNNERVLPSLSLRSAAAGVGNLGAGQSVWNGPFGATNGVVTGGIWDGSYVSSGSNSTITVTNATSTNGFAGVDIAFRGGLDKLTFVRVNFDSILAQGFIGLTNTFVDQFITNGVVRSQVVDRRMFEPDIVFRAGDLGLGGGNFPVVSWDGTIGPLNNYDINGAGAPGDGTLIRNGPGVLEPGNTIDLTTLFPFFWNRYLPGETEGPDDGPDSILNGPNGYYGAWGTFDGTTVDAIYPVWMNLQLGDLESLVRQSQLQQ